MAGSCVGAEGSGAGPWVGVGGVVDGPGDGLAEEGFDGAAGESDGVADADAGESVGAVGVEEQARLFVGLGAADAQQVHHLGDGQDRRCVGACRVRVHSWLLRRDVFFTYPTVLK